MGWINLNSILLQLLSTLVLVHCIEEHDIYPFSEALNSGMENDTNPCNDFHQYSCGKWIERNEVFDTSAVWNIYEMTSLSAIIKVKEILENPNTDENNEELSVEKKIYNACIDEDYSRREGYNLVVKIANGIPRERWQDVVEYYACKFSVFNLFHIRLGVTKLLKIERPLFSKSNKIVFNMNPRLINELISLYNSNYNSLFGDIRSLKDALKESLSFMEFINEITRNGKEEIQVFSILRLQQFYDHHCPSKHAKIEWLQFFQKLAEGTGINFTLNDELFVDTQYLISLCKLLTVTPAHAIVNYLQYNFLTDEDTQFHSKSYRGRLSSTEIYIHCIRTLPITEGITKEILKSHVTQESQNLVSEMFNNIKSALIKEIENSWLVNSVKEALVKRTSDITYEFGIVNDPLKIKWGESGTYEFEIGRVAVENELNFRRAHIIKILQVYNQVYKVHRGKRHLVCNAGYSLYENKITIEVAMLFPTYFYRNVPIGFNYGRIGFTIGHEISHAFDFNIISHYINCIPSKDERKKMESMLYRKRHCFVKMFNDLGKHYVKLLANQELTSIWSKGVRNLEENVADTQGLKLAWKGMNAFIQDRARRGEELPSSENWNQKKLFFLSFANIWCSNPEYRADNVLDTHAPSVIRIFGTLMNMNEFKEAYDCAEGDFMNPTTKCDWWSES